MAEDFGFPLGPFKVADLAGNVMSVVTIYGIC